MRRRALLGKTAALGSITALAGCLSDLSGGGDTTEEETTTETTTTTTTTTATTTQSLEVTNQSIETTNTGCGDGNEASISFTDSGASATGSIQANNPCHEASIVGTRILGDVLQVTVGTESTDADSCQSCIGSVEYEATLETNVAPTSVVVVHEYTPEGADEPVTEAVADKSNRD